MMPTAFEHTEKMPTTFDKNPIFPPRQAITAYASSIEALIPQLNHGSARRRRHNKYEYLQLRSAVHLAMPWRLCGGRSTER